MFKSYLLVYLSWLPIGDNAKMLKHQLLKRNAQVQKLEGSIQESDSTLLPTFGMLFCLGARDSVHLLPSIADTRETDVYPPYAVPPLIQ